jgi:cyclophilin family peptidyl-prolyl cis-trans isomerase
MAKADRRARKRQNQALAAQQRRALEQRQRRNKMIQRGIIVVVAIVVVVAAVSIFGGGDKSKAKPRATTTIAPATTPSTAALPAGCVATVPKTHGNGKTYKSAPAMTIDPAKTYTAVISTSCGPITVALDAKDSPKGVNNFVFLAQQGFYNGLTWHRAVNNFVIQGGDPKGDGTGGPGYSVVTEVPKRPYQTGDLAWAKAGNEPSGAAGSQFFVTTGDPSALNSTKDAKGGYSYGYFGHVTAGLDNAKKIESLNPAASGGDGPPTHPVYILSITIKAT